MCCAQLCWLSSWKENFSPLTDGQQLPASFPSIGTIGLDKRLKHLADLCLCMNPNLTPNKQSYSGKARMSSGAPNPCPWLPSGFPVPFQLNTPGIISFRWFCQLFSQMMAGGGALAAEAHVSFTRHRQYFRSRRARARSIKGQKYAAGLISSPFRWRLPHIFAFFYSYSYTWHMTPWGSWLTPLASFLAVWVI